MNPRERQRERERKRGREEERKRGREEERERLNFAIYSVKTQDIQRQQNMAQ